MWNWLKNLLPKKKVVVKPLPKVNVPDSVVAGAANQKKEAEVLSGFVEPIFVTVKGAKYKNQKPYATPSGKFEGLVVHYTVSGRAASNARGVVNYLASMGYGCMVMDEAGVIYIPEGFDIFTKSAAHAGVSKWGGRSGLSQYYAGMEICGWGLGSKEGPHRTVTTKEGYVVAGKYQAFTEAQEASLINFIHWAKSKNPAFNLDNVVGHDEARKEAGKLGDKQDPGGSLSMTMPQLRQIVKDKVKALGV